MTTREITGEVKWLFSRGMTCEEIVQRNRTSYIWTKHLLAKSVEHDSQLLGEHLRRNRRRKKWNYTNARIVGRDDYFDGGNQNA